MHLLDLRAINWEQLKIDAYKEFQAPGKLRCFIKKTVYYRPKDVSLKESNESLYTFAFTRHPFSRLVSAYHYCNEALNEVKDEIFSTYRKIHPRDGNDIPTPKMFVNYLLDKTKQHGPLVLNSHFRPQYAACPFCSLNFDYIGEIADMDTHVKYLAERFGFPVILENNITLLELSLIHI